MKFYHYFLYIFVFSLFSCSYKPTSISNPQDEILPEDRFLGRWSYSDLLSFINEAYEFNDTNCTYFREKDFPLHPDDTAENAEVLYGEWHISNDTIFICSGTSEDPGDSIYTKDRIYQYKFADIDTLMDTLLFMETDNNISEWKMFIRDTVYLSTHSDFLSEDFIALASTRLSSKRR